MHNACMVYRRDGQTKFHDPAHTSLVNKTSNEGLRWLIRVKKNSLRVSSSIWAIPRYILSRSGWISPGGRDGQTCGRSSCPVRKPWGSSCRVDVSVACVEMLSALLSDRTSSRWIIYGAVCGTTSPMLFGDPVTTYRTRPVVCGGVQAGWVGPNNP